MPRGVSRYDEAQVQRRLWTPDAVRSRGGAWYRFTDPSCLTFSSGNITGARDLFGLHDLTTATTGSGAITYVAGADVMAPHRVAAIPANSAYMHATLGTGTPLRTATVITVVALCRSASTVRRGLCTVRHQSTAGSFTSWAGAFADFCQRGADSFLSNYSGVVNIGYSVNTWFLWCAQFGVNAFLHEVFRNDALTATASANRGSAIGTTAGTMLTVGCADVAVGSNEGLDGQLAEIVFLTNATTDERRRCAGYIAHRYGRQGLLPAGHPFRNAPPLI